MADSTILDKCIKVGPWGYSEGKEWIHIPDGFIKKIRISHGITIDGIEFQSECRKGATQKTYFGAEGDILSRTDMICIDWPDEYLTSLSGTYGYRYNSCSTAVTSLSFDTNQNSYGPYGKADLDTPFSYDGEGGVIVGFHGCLGSLRQSIESIGLYVMPKALAMIRNSTFEENPKPEKCCRMSSLGMPRDVGPWGASGGKPWDDGVFYNIKQVRVQLGEPSKVIFGIQFKYVKKDSKFIMSRFHGGTDKDISEVEINLDGVQEYLTGISGFYGPVKGHGGLEGITSITFHTNKGKHGPYGQESEGRGVFFTSIISCGKVVGFHGRIGDFLTAIGVHVDYF